MYLLTLIGMTTFTQKDIGGVAVGFSVPLLALQA
jgi:hypothetical protein